MGSQGGVTNSRPSPEYGTPWGGGAVCSDAGVDTVRFRFRGVDGAYDRIVRHSLGAHEGPRGERWRHGTTGRVGVYPDGLAYVEGRAAALVEGSRDCHDLLTVGDLPLAEQAARAQMLEVVGTSGGEHAALGRVDLAAELRFSRGDEGQAFLHALRALDVPHGKVGMDGGKAGAIETVYVRGITGRSVHMRAYDKGLEAGTDGPGRRIRVERQIRPRKSREQTVAMFQASNTRAAFLGRLAAFQDVPSVCVADAAGAIDRLAELHDQGAISGSQLHRLTGYVVHRGRGLSRTRRYAHAQELRAVGVAFDPVALERSVVPVGRYLRALAAAWPEAA